MNEPQPDPVGRSMFLWFASCIACAVCCTAPAPRAPTRAPAPEGQLSAAPPSTPELPVSAAAEDDAMACITPPDPELDKASPWHQDLGRKLTLELAHLRHCTRDLPGDGEAELTLRLVYGQDGRPLSQHVVASSPEACALVDCLKDGLAKVNATKLEIERSSYDLALVLKQNQVPQPASEPVDPLVADASPESCVDAEVQRLSRRAVRDIVSTTYTKLKSCYDQALMRRHDAQGTVTFEFVIEEQGQVARVQARDSTLYDCEAIGCMLAEFRPLRFPAPVGRSVRVVYPIKYVLEQAPMQLR